MKPLDFVGSNFLSSEVEFSKNFQRNSHRNYVGFLWKDVLNPFYEDKGMSTIILNELFKNLQPYSPQDKFGLEVFLSQEKQLFCIRGDDAWYAQKSVKEFYETRKIPPDKGEKIIEDGTAINGKGLGLRRLYSHAKFIFVDTNNAKLYVGFEEGEQFRKTDDLNAVKEAYQNSDLLNLCPLK